MGTLTERDLMHWNRKLSGARRRLAGIIIFVAGAVLSGMMKFFSGLGAHPAPAARALLIGIMVIGGIIMVTGFLGAGLNSIQSIFVEAWTDINHKLFAEYNGHLISQKVMSGSDKDQVCAYEFINGPATVQSFVSHWRVRERGSDGKTHYSDRYACQCRITAGSPVIEQVGCSIELYPDVRETGSTLAKFNRGISKAITSGVEFLASMGQNETDKKEETILDNLEFEEKFDVKTNDNIKCRMYLTQERMEDILAMVQSAGDFSYVSIKPEGLCMESRYLGFMCAEKGHEYVRKCFPSRLSMEAISEYKDVMFSTCGIVQSML